MKQFCISTDLAGAWLYKIRGAAVSRLLQLFLLLPFSGINIYEFKNSDLPVPGRDAFYRMLSQAKYNWRKLIYHIAVKLIAEFQPLTNVDYVVFDSWFAHPGLLHRVGKHAPVVCQVKNVPTIQYRHNKRIHHLQGLYDMEPRSYVSMVAYTSIVFMRYMMFIYYQRVQIDEMTLPGMFRQCAKELQSATVEYCLLMLQWEFVASICQNPMQPVISFLNSFSQRIQDFSNMIRVSLLSNNHLTINYDS